MESSSDEEKAKALYNQGNTHFKMGKMQESLDAYKKSLLLNPNDEDARFNYALVKKILQAQQEQQKKDDQKKDEEKKEENKDNQENKQEEEQKKEEQDEKKEDQKQDQQQEQQQNQQQQEQQQQQKQMKRKNAENLLDALNQQEKGVQRKVNKAKGSAKKVKIEKDW